MSLTVFTGIGATTAFAAVGEKPMCRLSPKREIPITTANGDTAISTLNGHKMEMGLQYSCKQRTGDENFNNIRTERFETIGRILQYGSWRYFDKLEVAE